MTTERNSLDREGQFKVKPLSWNVYNAKSGAVAINIDFLVTAQWNGSDWDSWADYEPHAVRGAYYVVKKDGAINSETVSQLVNCLGWNGELAAVLQVPPDVVVQVAVRAEEYNGLTVYKAGWMSAADSNPSYGASPAEVKALDGRFGSLLRAAAGMAKPPAAKLPF